MNSTGSKFVTGLLKDLLQQQLTHQKNGDYKKAEECRIKFQDQKKNDSHKSLNDLQNTHRRQKDELKNQHNDELNKFNQFWDKKLSDFHKDCQKLQNDLSEKHKKECNDKQKYLNQTLPINLKESSQLLNLRKMEQHMAKQKNYPEAHKIQQKANKMCSQQTSQWNINRKNKIDTALDTLKNKQNLQMQALKKRNKTHLEQQLKDRKITQDTINHKYQNLMNDLKILHEKQVLAFKGQYRTLGGIATGTPSPQRGGKK